MQVRVLRNECCGNAECVAIAPEVFVIDSHQKAIVLDPDAVPVEKLIEAANECPCSAIVVENDEGEIVFP
jgi:ferredoxin